MFGSVRKTKERWGRKSREIHAPVINELNDLLVRVTHQVGVAHGFREDEVKAKALLEQQGKIVLGFEAIRRGAHPREIFDPLVGGAAMVAQIACNTAILTGRLDLEKTAGDLRYLLGFSRDGSEIRQMESN
jgi:hypothetical protein